ncbi:MAG: peptidoglycan bridge formation glycyltransferase FemA/FemB family protein [Anaerolineales bacterium]|nr:peptidoglycan bridge formation glycyltransferase FemA/FemB family protein [Anaerolineales bacterium]
MKSSVYQFGDIESWDGILRAFPDSHVLQTREWAQIKSQFGWQSMYKIWREEGQVFAAAMILMRTVQLGFLPIKWRIMYVPKGPLLINWSNTMHRDMVLNDLYALAQENEAIFIKIDPDIITGFGLPGDVDYNETDTGKSVVEHMHSLKWQFSQEQIQFRNTVIIDLTQDEITLLKNLKQKTRYNLRLASRKGVNVRMGDEHDFETLFHIYAETASRDGFVIREKQYYMAIWDLFLKTGMGQPFIAEYEGDVIAGMILFHFGCKSWFLYGMSCTEHRDKMPNYLLQWEAIRYSKTLGCNEYDLWGAPDSNSEFDPLRNVYRFKQGLGGRVVRHIGAWDRPIKPFAYHLYMQLLPKLLAFRRYQSRKQIAQIAHYGE